MRLHVVCTFHYRLTINVSISISASTVQYSASSIFQPYICYAHLCFIVDIPISSLPSYSYLLIFYSILCPQLFVLFQIKLSLIT